MKTSFELFIGLWNAQQNHATPVLHKIMLSWLAQQSRNERKRLLLMAFRGSGKSTLVGLFCAWLLTHEPDLRILIIAADEDLAEHMVRHVRAVLETHPLTRDLLPLKKEQWAADRVTIQRKLVSRDPSLRAAGITSNVTGARADIIICDDVEVPKTCETAWKREQLRQKLGELDFILTPGGMMLYIGTPHAEDSLYKPGGFLQEFQRLELPLTTASWPERFTPETIAQLQRAVGPRIFASQMELRPVNLTQAVLDPLLLVPYDGVVPQPVVAKRAWWDPSFGSENGDASIVVCVAFDAQNNAYLHDVVHLRAQAENAAGEQCAQIVAFIRKHHLTQIMVEANGIGAFLPGLLRQALRAAETRCAVQVIHNTRNKTQRILEAFEARLAARALYIHRSVTESGFLQEMKDWRPHQPKPRDDRLDAVAGALLHAPPPINFTKPFFMSAEDQDD